MRIFELYAGKAGARCFIRPGGNRYINIDEFIQMGRETSYTLSNLILDKDFTELIPGTDDYEEISGIYELIDWLLKD